MKSKAEIINSLKNNSDILHEYHINRIGIFGSYATGQATENSDIDLLVDFSETLTLPQYVHLTDSITSCLTIKADVVPIKGIKPYLKDKILNEVEWIEGL